MLSKELITLLEYFTSKYGNTEVFIKDETDVLKSKKVVNAMAVDNFKGIYLIGDLK